MKQRVKSDPPDGVVIPHSLLTNPDVSAVTVRLYGVLISLSCPAYEFLGRRVAVATPGASIHGYSQRDLADECQVKDERTISTAVTELVNLGYITEEPAQVWREAAIQSKRGWEEITGRPKTYRLLPLPQ